MVHHGKQASRYEIAIESELRVEDVNFINASLDAFNRALAGEDHHQPLAVFMREAETGEIAGGLVGMTFWGWLHIELLWVREDLRHTGYGRRLVEEAEAEARRRGCRRAFVATESFQAPGFYQSLGYVVYAELPDLPPGFVRYYLKKDLTGELLRPK
ncbi:MAG TPA: GNAT family N-acetyltransferase [Thermomicrobiaceae bacterium]|nr:GNAT family N-acetyltransferase [Thermomicrobiaceae bacterium]